MTEIQDSQRHIAASDAWTRTRGLALSFLLSVLFLAVTAVQSIATLLFRMRGDVMKAATGDILSGEIARETAYFLAAQVLLHLAFGFLIWLLARASALAWPTVRRHLTRAIFIWFSVLAAAVIAYNAMWYPRTGIGAYYHDFVARPVGPLTIAQIIYYLAVAAAMVTLIAAAKAWYLGADQRAFLKVTGYSAGVLVIAALVTFVHGHNLTARAVAAQTQPHVIILGIDSLRLDQLRRFGGTGVTPNLDRFLETADIVRDTTTPVARTFPSWAAILSGRSPKVTGARFNLAARDSIQVNPTIGDVLRSAGYRTVYSTDEVRFANIDKSYGFDQVVTPPIGAADFVIGNYNELPLVSVIADTWLGRWLFPYSYGNRGAATLFQPRTFLTRLNREVDFDRGPVMFISHLTASHWPYFVADTPMGVVRKEHRDDRPLYRVGLQIADEMFGNLIGILERKGALKNAIVIVLSDHGEALALPQDTMIAEGSRVDGLRAPLMVMDSGHGQSVLSPVQFQVLLGFRSFGPGAGFSSSGRNLPGSATVEDIAPTLLALLGINSNPLHATGESFADTLQAVHGADRVGSASRVRFTETDLRVLPSTDGGVDEVATAKANSKFFEVSSETGRMSIRKAFAPLSLAYKERAAFNEEKLLAILPAGPDAQQFILVEKSSGQARLLLGPPGEADPQAQRLWDAAAKQFAGELRRPVSITQDDWPLIEEQWRTFFTRRNQGASPMTGGPTG